MFLRHALQVMAVITLLAGSRAAAGADDKPTTFTKDIAPIINKHCLACHRKGQVAPFGMETYEQVMKRASRNWGVIRGWMSVPGSHSWRSKRSSILIQLDRLHRLFELVLQFLHRLVRPNHSDVVAVLLASDDHTEQPRVRPIRRLLTTKRGGIIMP